MAFGDLGRAFVAATTKRGLQFLLQNRLDEDAHPQAHPLLQRIKGVVAGQ